jgi:hypothetical protein
MRAYCLVTHHWAWRGSHKNTSTNTFSLVACAYFGCCLEMCLHVTICFYRNIDVIARITTVLYLHGWHWTRCLLMSLNSELFLLVRRMSLIRHRHSKSKKKFRQILTLPSMPKKNQINILRVYTCNTFINKYKFGIRFFKYWRTQFVYYAKFWVFFFTKLSVSQYTYISWNVRMTGERWIENYLKGSHSGVCVSVCFTGIPWTS